MSIDNRLVWTYKKEVSKHRQQSYINNRLPFVHLCFAFFFVVQKRNELKCKKKLFKFVTENYILQYVRKSLHPWLSFWCRLCQSIGAVKKLTFLASLYVDMRPCVSVEIANKYRREMICTISCAQKRRADAYWWADLHCISHWTKGDTFSLQLHTR